MKIVTDRVNGCEYFTAGKKYTVITDYGNGAYDVLSDRGVRTTVFSKNCPHVHSNWRIAEYDTLDEVFAADEVSRIGQEIQPEDYIVTPEEEEEFKRMEEKQYDMVNNPKHYQLLPGVEVKDVRKAILDNAPEGIPYTQIDAWSRCWEYMTRMWNKNGLEDAKKARVYLNWLIEDMEKGNGN